MQRNSVVLLTFLTEAAILNMESDVVEILKIFARSVTERAEEEEDAGGDDDNKEDKKTTKTGKTKQATA